MDPGGSGVAERSSASLVRMQHYTTGVNKKRLTKVERSQIIIENPLNEIIIGLLLGDVKLNLFKLEDLHFEPIRHAL